jgi:alkylation response protein AidB-like acyl-CoA dehydrogenase
MAQPDNFGFGEEAALLKASARKFFSEKFPTSDLHALVAGDHRPERGSECLWNRELWQEMVDLGWTMLAVPEAAGGVGMPAVAVAGLAEELGRAAFPCPLLGTINATYVLAACGSGGQSALGEIAEGRSASMAITNQAGSWSPGDTDVTCVDGKLQGTAWYVQDARKADRLLVSAHTPAGLGLYWVATDAPGITISPDTIVDLTRDQAHISFDQVVAEEVSANGLAALAEAMPALWTVLAADMVGAAEWQLQTTVEYVSTRQQFDRPLGFFQAVKHPLVNVMLQIDQAKSLVYNAACAIDSEPERAQQYAHMAKASASETAAYASGRSVQCHGGIGFTWECYVHLYFKRQKHSQMLWGDAAWHRARLADIVIGPMTGTGR